MDAALLRDPEERDSFLDSACAAFRIRRRLARVLGAGHSQRAADALLVALDDLRFEVRYESARSLAAIAKRNRSVRVDTARVTEVIRNEVMRGQSAWENLRLVDRSNADPEARANLALEYVFTLLSLVVPDASLQVAFRGLFS